MICVMAAMYIRMFDAVAPASYRVLTGALITNAVINVSDMLAYLFRGNVTHTGYVMVRISNFLVFVGMFVLLLFGSALLDAVLGDESRAADNRLRNAVRVICTAGIALVVLSRVFGFLYGFDEQNLYHRGGGYVIMPLLGVAAIVLLAVRTVIERKLLRRNEFRAFMCLWILPALGATTQIFYYGISLSNIANSLSILIILGIFMGRIYSEISIKRSFILKAESIEDVSERLEKFLTYVGTERQNRIRIRFTIEEALISIWKAFGEPSMVKVTASVRFGKPQIKIEHEGEPFNPFSISRGGTRELGSKLLESAGLSPSYSYFHGFNIIRVGLIRMRVNPIITIGMAIIFGLLTGTVASAALSPADSAFIAESILVPVYDLWNNILCCAAAPAMFIIVMSTMLDTREVYEQGGNAGVLTGRYFIISILMGIVAVGFALLIRTSAFTVNAINRGIVAEVIEEIFNVVPQNIFDPIKEFDTTQLIIMGVILAYAIMSVGQKADGVASLIHQLNRIFAKIAEWIAAMMPVFAIFLTALLAIRGDAGLLLGLLRIIPFALIVSLIVMAATLIYVGRRMDVGVGILLRKLMPSFLLTFRTGQVADSYALAETCCRKQLGIQKIYTEKVLGLGLVLYMPMSMIGMMSFVMYAAGRSGIALTPLWVITAVFFALVLLVAAPPIPGINLLSYVVIMGQLGIGSEYIIFAMIFDIIFDMFASAANQTMLQLDLVLQADRTGLLDRKVLRDPDA